MTRLLIFSDLDGTLLDHHSYSHAEADDLLYALNQRAIPVIPCTSKTRAELLRLRRELRLNTPFIVENGAAVLIPKGQLDSPQSELTARDGFWLKSFTPDRSHWLKLLATLDSSLTSQFRGFSSMSIAEISALTGLDETDALLASQREYGEPVQWLGDEPTRSRFIDALRAKGASVLQGGRFMHISGNCDKGQALRWLAGIYATLGQCNVITAALGDSHNDVAMLEAADYPFIVRSPVHPPPAIRSARPVPVSQAVGPAGWAQLVQGLLQTIEGAAHSPPY